jgi:hypothetical protein
MFRFTTALVDPALIHLARRRVGVRSEVGRENETQERDGSVAGEPDENTNKTFTPGPTPNTVRSADGRILTAPERWLLLPPGDAALTRRVKAAGDHWVVQEKKGRKVFSRGVWAPAATVERIRAELIAERSTDRFAKRKTAEAIPRVKGKQREVRRMLARRSHELLEGYRRGEGAPGEYPLRRTLAGELAGDDGVAKP